MSQHSTTIPAQTRRGTRPAPAPAHRAPEHADTAVLEVYAELGLLAQPAGRHLLVRADVAVAR